VIVHRRFIPFRDFSDSEEHLHIHFTGVQIDPSLLVVTPADVDVLKRTGNHIQNVPGGLNLLFERG